MNKRPAKGYKFHELIARLQRLIDYYVNVAIRVMRVVVEWALSARIRYT